MIFHSDRGCQYTSAAYAALAEENQVTLSVGRTGQCGDNAQAEDNAVIEAWHSTLEFGLRRAEHFATRAAARARVAAWIEHYNTRRRHSACQMMPPARYQQVLAAREAA